MNAHECSCKLAISAYKGFGVIKGLIQEYTKMLILKMTSLSYFGNISVQISLNVKKLDIFKIYTKRAVDPKEAEKFKIQKWKQFCWTPCINSSFKRRLMVANGAHDC